MRRLAPAISIFVLVLAACGSSTPTSEPTVAPVSPSPTAPSDVATPTPAVSPTPAATPEPPATPKPTVKPTPKPTPLVANDDEQYLIDGFRRGVTDCHPVREDLPAKAIAGVECASDEPSVARIGVYLFKTDKAMLAAYDARMDAEGVKRESGGCIDGEGEGAYVPYEGESPDRDGCFVNAEGYANYRATISGNHVYIGILGRSADMKALDDFAWRGNQDTPGWPTLWMGPGN